MITKRNRDSILLMESRYIIFLSVITGFITNLLVCSVQIFGNMQFFGKDGL